MRIGIDYTPAVRQRAGIGRYTRGLVHALLQLDAENVYRLLIPGDALYADSKYARSFARAPLTEHQLVILWQRLRIPLPVELVTGPVDIFYSPDFVLPPSRARYKFLTVHDFSYVRVPECHYPGNLLYLNSAVPRAVKQADLILADSNSTKNDLVEIYRVPPERIRTLYSGVERNFRPVTDVNESARVRAKYNLTRPFILSVGTLEPRKNYQRLIQAFAQMGAGPDCELLIAGGKGWLFDPILAAPARFGVSERVRFLGFVPDEDLPALYSLTRLFVYPSLYEGFGLPVLEAMVCGAPTVTANNSSLPEVAGDACLLVDARNVDELTTTMEKGLVQEELRQTMREKGFAQAKKFSWEASAATLRDAFETMAVRQSHDRVRNQIGV